MLALRASGTFAVTGFLTVCAVGDAARAQGGAEPITVAYEAPNECPDADAFFREVAARTTHARAAKPGDRARRLHVVVARRGHVYAGKLWIEETETSSSAREVIGAACADVVGALSLVAAVAVDSEASVAQRTAQQATIRPASAPEVGAKGPPAGEPAPRPPGSDTAGTSSSAPDGIADGPPTKGPASGARPSREAPPQVQTRPASMRFAVGAQLQVAEIAGVVFAGRVFGELQIEDSARAWAPSLRVAISRSLDIERRASVGHATLGFTELSLEGCPLTAAIGAHFIARPCIGASGGVLKAQGKNVRLTNESMRPWATAFAYAQLAWSPFQALALEIDAGALAPLYRDTFFFTGSPSNLPIYQAPPVAFVGRVGVRMRFP